MKVVFCLYGDSLSEYARMMVATCKWQGYEVIQIADKGVKQIEGVDDFRVVPMEVPPVLWRYQVLADLEPPYLSLDVDLLVVRDVSEGFDTEYDACLTHRENKEGMIYNGGVIFVNRRGFMEACCDMISDMRPEWQQWTGGQRAMAELASAYRIKELPCLQWNYSPENIKDRPSGVRILHYKGKRKGLMKDAYEALRIRRERSLVA